MMGGEYLREKKYIALIVLVLILVLFAGDIVNAGIDVVAIAMNRFRSIIDDTASEKTTMLLSKLDNNMMVQTNRIIDDLLPEKRLTAEEELEMYYNDKLFDMLDSGGNLDDRIDTIMNEILEQYKREIDDAFDRL